MHEGFHSTSGASGLQTAPAEGVGTGRHEGGNRESTEREVELELIYWATGAVSPSSFSLSLGPGRGRKWQKGLRGGLQNKGWTGECQIELARSHDRNGRDDPKPDDALFPIQNRSTQSDSWETTNIDVIEGYASFTTALLGAKMVKN